MGSARGVQEIVGSIISTYFQQNDITWFIFLSPSPSLPLSPLLYLAGTGVQCSIRDPVFHHGTSPLRRDQAVGNNSLIGRLGQIR